MTEDGKTSSSGNQSFHLGFVYEWDTVRGGIWKIHKIERLQSFLQYFIYDNDGSKYLKFFSVPPTVHWKYSSVPTIQLLFL